VAVAVTAAALSPEAETTGADVGAAAMADAA
jgi:hypothetical protein